MTTSEEDFYSGPELWSVKYQVEGQIDVQEKIGFKTLRSALAEMNKIERVYFPQGVTSVTFDRVWVQPLPEMTAAEIEYLNERFDNAMADPDA